MAKERKKLHYLADWRKYRGLSLRRLAERLEREPGEELISVTSLSRIERGEQPLTPEVLHASAFALDCQPGDIIEINPLLDPELIDLMAVIRKLNPARRVEATNILKAIA